MKYVDPDGHAWFDAIPGTIGAVGNFGATALAYAFTRPAIGALWLIDPKGAAQANSGLNDAFGRVLHIQTGIAASAVVGDTAGAAVGAGVQYVKNARQAASATGASERVGYHATDSDVVALIEKSGFKNGQAPGRLGANGVYVNNTAEGAIAEFTFHNPGKTPAVLKVKYSPGVEAVTDVTPNKYIKDIPLNVDSVSAPSVRAPKTENTNVFNNSVSILERMQ